MHTNRYHGRILPLQRKDYHQFQKTVTQASRELDKLENASLPSVKINHQQLQFEEIRYRSAKTCSFVMENTGKVF